MCLIRIYGNQLGFVELICAFCVLLDFLESIKHSCVCTLNVAIKDFNLFSLLLLARFPGPFLTHPDG